MEDEWSIDDTMEEFQLAGELAAAAIPHFIPRRKAIYKDRGHPLCGGPSPQVTLAEGHPEKEMALVLSGVTGVGSH
jgi:hypothetical protein